MEKVLLLLVVFTSAVYCAELDTTLSRRKRHLVFPEGTTLSVAIELTAQTIVATDVWTETCNYGIAYELPNTTDALRTHQHSSGISMQRRYRRDLYGKMETIMNSMGFDGQSCIFRVLCETTSLFRSKGDNIVEEMVRTVFRFPRFKSPKTLDEKDHEDYHKAHEMGTSFNREKCSELYPKCSISLLDMVLGYFAGYNDKF